MVCVVCVGWGLRGGGGRRAVGKLSNQRKRTRATPVEPLVYSNVGSDSKFSDFMGIAKEIVYPTWVGVPKRTSCTFLSPFSSPFSVESTLPASLDHL